MTINRILGTGQKLMFAAGEVAGGSGSGGREPIVLYCDLKVDPKREQEMLITIIVHSSRLRKNSTAISM